MLKKTLVGMLIGSLLAAQAGAQQAGPATRQVKVTRRTVLKFTTLNSLDSTTAKIGDDVPLRLVEPLVVDDITLIPAGETVHGTVKRVRRAGPNGRNGWVDWELKRIRFADSTTAKVQTGYLSNLSNWDAFWLFVVLTPFLPLALPDLLCGNHGEKRPKVSTPGTEYLLPANSEIIVSIKKDHHVRY